MNAFTWKPETNTPLDKLFDELRLKQEKTTHPLASNYTKNNFKDCLAFSIVFENDLPILCSSILGRNCWPNNVYRILNRLWKVNDFKNNPIQNTHPTVGPLITSQINWLKENTDFELIFISRETPNWQKWSVFQLSHNYGFEFEYDDYKYLTCPNFTNESCWQRIIYQGNKDLLKLWERK